MLEVYFSEQGMLRFLAEYEHSCAEVIRLVCNYTHAGFRAHADLQRHTAAT